MSHEISEYLSKRIIEKKRKSKYIHNKLTIQHLYVCSLRQNWVSRYLRDITKYLPDAIHKQIETLYRMTPCKPFM